MLSMSSIVLLLAISVPVVGQMIDGGWTLWSEWESTVTCSHGTKGRARTCTNPIPQNGGANCEGHTIQIQRRLPGESQSKVNGGLREWGEWKKHGFGNCIFDRFRDFTDSMIHQSVRCKTPSTVCSTETCINDSECPNGQVCLIHPSGKEGPVCCHDADGYRRKRRIRPC